MVHCRSSPLEYISKLDTDTLLWLQILRVDFNTRSVMNQVHQSLCQLDVAEYKVLPDNPSRVLKQGHSVPVLILTIEVQHKSCFEQSFA